MRKRMLRGIVAAVCMVGALTVAASPADAAAPKVSHNWNRPANNDEIGLMVLANKERAHVGQLPYMWDDNLAAAARQHSQDMGENRCFKHNSCRGGNWAKRVGSFFPGWTYLGENIGAGSTDARFLHSGWMGSAGHRANIMSGAFNKFGAGIVIGEDGFGPLPLGTEDFGAAGLISLTNYPVIPAGAVMRPDQPSSNTREILVNYYKYPAVAPDSVEAIVGTRRITLGMITGGQVGNATYGSVHTFPTSCTPVYFEVKVGGQTHRWPTTGTISIGPDSAQCQPTGPPTAELPTVTIRNLNDNQLVSGKIEVRADATDAQGTVDWMELWIDGKRVRTSRTGTIAQIWNVDAPRYERGSIEIEVKAWDNEDYLGTASVVVIK